MVKARYSNQQGFNSRQNLCYKYNQRRTPETYRRQGDVFVWVRSPVCTVEVLQVFQNMDYKLRYYVCIALAF